MNLNGKPRAKPGTLKAQLTAMQIGDVIPCADSLERNKFYVMGPRYGIKLRREGNVMRRIQ